MTCQSPPEFYDRSLINPCFGFAKIQIEKWDNPGRVIKPLTENDLRGLHLHTLAVGAMLMFREYWIARESHLTYSCAFIERTLIERFFYAAAAIQCPENSIRILLYELDQKIKNADHYQKFTADDLGKHLCPDDFKSELSKLVQEADENCRMWKQEIENLKDQQSLLLKLNGGAKAFKNQSGIFDAAKKEMEKTNATALRFRYGVLSTYAHPTIDQFHSMAEPPCLIRSDLYVLWSLIWIAEYLRRWLEGGDTVSEEFKILLNAVGN